jgi:hypothetical protein
LAWFCLGGFAGAFGIASYVCTEIAIGASGDDTGAAKGAGALDAFQFMGGIALCGIGASGTGGTVRGEFERAGALNALEVMTEIALCVVGAGRTGCAV